MDDKTKLKIWLVNYEIRATWWAYFIARTSNVKLQELIGKYFAWKVERKFSRLMESEKERQELVDLGIMKTGRFEFIRNGRIDTRLS